MKVEHLLTHAAKPMPVRPKKQAQKLDDSPTFKGLGKPAQIEAQARELGSPITAQMRELLRQIDEHVRDGRFQRSLSLIAGVAGVCTGIEVSLEHYKGSFSRRIMYSPPALGLLLGLAGTASAIRPRAARVFLPAASWALILDGLIGFGFHVRGIARKPGGWDFYVTNLVLGPPVFAPLLLGIGGILGLVAARLQPEESVKIQGAGHHAHLQKMRLLLTGATAISASLNGFEALYSHYKSGFRKRSQWIPIVVTPPLVAISVAALAHEKSARKALPVISTVAIAAGTIGFAFHLRGILRRPGFKQDPFYALVHGPPPLAPLLFAASGFLGLMASRIGYQD